MDRPDYDPIQRRACWLSSEDVKAEIVALAEGGADKAVCWDMMQAMERLAARQPLSDCIS